VQVADGEIEISVLGASKQLLADSNSTASDVSLPTVDSIPGSDANFDVPSSSSELLNTSLDTSVTPKAESCGADICAATLVEETVEAVVANGENHDGYADNADDRTTDVPDDQFFPASEGRLL